MGVELDFQECRTESKWRILESCLSTIRAKDKRLEELVVKGTDVSIVRKRFHKTSKLSEVYHAAMPVRIGTGEKFEECS